MHANYEQSLGSLWLCSFPPERLVRLYSLLTLVTHTHKGRDGSGAEVNWAFSVCGADFGVGSRHKVSSRGGSIGVGLRMNLAEICSYRVGIGVQEIKKTLVLFLLTLQKWKESFWFFKLFGLCSLGWSGIHKCAHVSLSSRQASCFCFQVHASQLETPKM